MQPKTLEISLSKEERRIVDEYGNSASTWARIGFTVELAEGDDPTTIIGEMREIIQPQVDDWLLRQGGYIAPVEDRPAEEIPELAESQTLADFLQETGGVLNNQNGNDSGDDDIPL